MRKNKRLSGAVSEAMERRLLFTSLSSLNVLTHHEDAVNDGANQTETVLSPVNVNATDFGKQFTNTVDGGDVIAEPLYMQNVNITTGTSPGDHSVVFIATEADGLYALDANTGATLWHDNFTNVTDPTNLTPTAGVTTVLQSDIANNPDEGAQLGILATPAIDAGTGTIYLNVNTKEIRTDGKHFVQRLWAVSINNGAAVMAPAVIGDTIAPNGVALTANNVAGPYTYVAGPIINGTGNNDPYDSSGNTIPISYPNTDGWTAAPGGQSGYVIAFNAVEQMERTAVTIINGTVYLGFASHGDTGPYYGWVLGYSESNLTLTAAFNTTPTYEPSTVVQESQPFQSLGGIWMSGSGISTDGTNLYVVTGNGAFNGAASDFNAAGFPVDGDYGNTVLKLTPDSSTVTSQNVNGWGLTVSDYFTPSNQYELNVKDLDLGSGGATLLSGNLLMVGGKESRIYLINTLNMGKFNFNYPEGDSTVDPSTYDRVVAEYAYNGLNNGGAQVYSSAAVYDGNAYLGLANHPALEFNIAAAVAGNPAPTTTSTSFGYPGETWIVSSNGSTNGIVWAENPAGAVLVAYNASSFTNPIYSSGTNAADALGGTIHFHVPTEIQGMVYAGSRGGGLGGYGLDLSYLMSAPGYFSAPTNLVSTLSTSTDAHLTWTSNSSLATEFRVDRSVNGTSWTTLSYVQSAVNSYDDLTITPNTKYYYRVVAVSGVNLTPFSNTAVYTPQLIMAGQNTYLRLDPNGTSLDVWTNATANGGVAESIVLSQLPGITVNATGATSSLTVDFSNGDPLPAAGLIFNGSGIGSLNIIGDSGNDSVVVNAATLSVTSTFGTVPISYNGATFIRFTGGTGSNTLTQTAVPGGGASVAFNNLNSADAINVSAGSMIIPMQSSGTAPPVTQLTTLIIGSGAEVAVAAPTGSAGHGLLELGSLSLAGSTSNWLGQLDLAGNDLLLHSASLALVDNQIQSGINGIISSALGRDSTHLTTLGAIVNNDGTGQPLYGSATAPGTFDTISPSVTDTLIKGTYYGDANLDGKVDGSDYSRIDSNYTSLTSGWFNGDFNYDGVVDGSDYTLIDNAFNRQGLTAPTTLATANTISTTVGASSSAITVSLRNALGGSVVAPVGGITINLSTTSIGGTFFNASTPIATLLIPAGSSSGTFEYQDSVFGTPTITLSAAGLLSATRLVTVASASTDAELAITSSPIRQAVGSTSGAVAFSLEDANGNSIVAPTGGVVVNLASSSINGIFKSNTSGAVITSLTIPAGVNSAAFKYSDTTPGIATVALYATGLVSSSQQETLTATLTSIAFTTPATTLVAGASPGTVTIQLDDQAGNPIPAGSGGVTIALGTNSSGGVFFNSNNVAVTSVTVPTGASSVTLAYRDSNIGTPTLTATVTGLGSISQQQKIVALPTGTVSFYSFSSSAGFLNDTGGSGNTLAVGGGAVAYTANSLPAGFTGAASFSGNGFLNTSSGAFPVNVPTGNNPYTIAAWIDVNNTNNDGIVGWGTYGTTDQVNAFRTANGAAALDNYWWNNDQVEPTSSSLVGNWTYIAVTYDGTTRSIYADGILLGTYSNGAAAVTANNFEVGNTDNNEFFGGNMSDLLIASTAFSNTVIDELYNGVVPVPTQIAFTNAAHTMVASTSPASVTIQLEAANGTAAVAGTSGVVVNLSTTSTGGTFYNSSDGIITSITIPAGSSSVTVAYRDTVVGTPTLTAAVSGFTSITQQQTVGALPTGTVAYYTFGSSTGLLTDTSGSGNTLKVGAGTVAFTAASAALPAGFTGAATFSNNGYLTTASGAFPVNVPTGNSSYTIAGWIDINNANKNGIVGWGTWGTGDEVNGFRTTQGDTGAANGAGLDNYWWNDDYVQPTVNLVNNWVYAAVTYNGLVRSIYVNGVLVGTFSSANKDNATAINFRIGDTNTTEYFGGSMADLLIANTAFSTAQLDALFNGT